MPDWEEEFLFGAVGEAGDELEGRGVDGRGFGDVSTENVKVPFWEGTGRGGFADFDVGELFEVAAGAEDVHAIDVLVGIVMIVPGL